MRCCYTGRGFRYPEKAALPPNLAEAEALAPGLNPIGAAIGDLAVDIETPSGRVLAIDDPELLRELAEGAADVGALDLLRSERAMTDCRPVSLFSLQTARQLSDELGMSLDTRRFRANVYLDLEGSAGFAEEGLVGRRLRIGSRLVVSVVERDPRCNMITLDPDTGAPNADILPQSGAVARRYRRRLWRCPGRGGGSRRRQGGVAGLTGSVPARREHYDGQSLQAPGRI